MKEGDHCTPDVCAGATANGQIVQVYVDHNHPLLQLKRALPWAEKKTGSDSNYELTSCLLTESAPSKELLPGREQR